MKCYLSNTVFFIVTNLWDIPKHCFFSNGLAQYIMTTTLAKLSRFIMSTGHPFLELCVRLIRKPLLMDKFCNKQGCCNLPRCRDNSAMDIRLGWNSVYRRSPFLEHSGCIGCGGPGLLSYLGWEGRGIPACTQQPTWLPTHLLLSRNGICCSVHVWILGLARKLHANKTTRTLN